MKFLEGREVGTGVYRVHEYITVLVFVKTSRKDRLHEDCNIAQVVRLDSQEIISRMLDYPS
jgi:hypothetical protein